MADGFVTIKLRKVFGALWKLNIDPDIMKDLSMAIERNEEMDKMIDKLGDKYVRKSSR